ncbi:MAG TPA: hypothetical protein VHC94_16100 [Nitrobacter sp.]|nr:hypothetical protein [Nitrobacter sp.]
MMIMRNLFPDESIEMDTATSLWICRAIGGRLRDDMQPASSLPPRLQRLLAALDHEGGEGPTADPTS